MNTFERKKLELKLRVKKQELINFSENREETIRLMLKCLKAEDEISRQMIPTLVEENFNSMLFNIQKEIEELEDILKE